MAGKSFKGNLEVLNLSDIFQSLAMNRHSGTLIVTDGKREKKIFFAEGEITLLSSSRRQRLGDMLVAEGKISTDELELALKLQKQSKKRLGEILVEEGFCTEEDIDRLVRLQIEEEIYDLFLWRKAEFEFIADQMPEDMARESPNLTRLAFNTNSLIMEALRRLDEWSLIRNLVPTTKEVFVLVDPEAVETANVPERMRGDARKRIDGKTTVEGLAERFLVSEFEMCKHLAELVQAGAIRALTPEQLAEKAEESYALNDFAGAAALYGRLAEYFPEVPKILIPLADSLRRTGAEKQALVIYEQLATQLESGGDSDRLRRCYEAITQLDPSRVDLARKLEEMDLRQLTKPRRGGLLPVALALLVVGGGAGALLWKRWKDQQGAGEADKLEAKKLLDELDEAILAAQSASKKSEEAYQRWFEKGLELWSRFPSSSEARKVTLPVLVHSVPSGFKVYVNDRLKGVTKPEEPFLACTYDPATAVVVELRRPEGEGQLFKRVYEAKKWPGVVSARIVDRPDATCVDDLRLDASVAWSDALQAWVTPSRTGKLRVLRPGDLGSLARWDGIELGELGDPFSDPVVMRVGEGERLLVGAVEGGVLAIDLGTVRTPGGGSPGEPPAEPVQRRYPAQAPVSAAPVWVPDQVVPGGRVVVCSTAGEIKAYPIEGGKPAWSVNAEAAIRFTPLTVRGGKAVVVCADDATVTAYDLADGKVLWSWDGPGLPQGPAQRLGEDRLLLRVGGDLILLAAETGAFQVSWPGGGRPFLPCADPGGARVYVTLPDGEVRALDGKTFAEVWKQRYPARSGADPASAAPALLALRGPRLIVAWGYPPGAEATEDVPALVALDAQSGLLVWQSSYRELQGQAVALTATAQGTFLSTGARNLYRFADEEY